MGFAGSLHCGFSCIDVGEWECERHI